MASPICIDRWFSWTSGSLRVMNKLEIDNVAQLTKYAIQEGLTTSEP